VLEALTALENGSAKKCIRSAQSKSAFHYRSIGPPPDCSPRYCNSTSLPNWRRSTPSPPAKATLRTSFAPCQAKVALDCFGDNESGPRRDRDLHGIRSDRFVQSSLHVTKGKAVRDVVGEIVPAIIANTTAYVGADHNPIAHLEGNALKVYGVDTGLGESWLAEDIPIKSSSPSPQRRLFQHSISQFFRW
jgi:hypothetical protein